MAGSNRLRKRAILALFLLAQACSKQTSSWTYEEISAETGSYSRALFPPENEYSGIEIEIHKYATVLKVHSVPLSESEVTFRPIAKDKGELKFSLKILKGGGSALLSNEGSEKLIELLQNGFDVEIVAGRYRQVITSEQFSHCIKMLNLR